MFEATLQRYRAAYAGLPREVWLMAFAIFVNRCGTMVMPFMTIYVTSQLGMSEAQAGRLVSVYGLGAVCGAYVGGRLARRAGEVRLQTVCLFLAAPGYLAIAFVDTEPALAATLFTLAFVVESIRPANSAAITKLTRPETRTRAFALNRLAANLGFSFGPAIGGVLATYNFNLLFIVDAATTLLAAILLLRFFGMKRLEPVTSEPHESAAPVSPLRDRPFVLFLALFLPAMIVFCQFSSTYPLYLRDHFGLSKVLIGLMFAVNTTVIVVFEMLLIDAIGHWSLVRTISFGTLLTCIGFGMLPFGSSLAYAIGAMLVFTLGEMLSASLAAAYVSNRSSHGAAYYMGWFSVASSIAWVLGPGIGTALYQQNHQWPWFASLAVGGFIFAGFQMLAARTPDERVSQLASLDEPVDVSLPIRLPEMHLDDAAAAGR